MGNADVSAGEDKILYVLRNHRSQGQSPRLGSRMKDGGIAFGIIKSLGEMIVHGPTGVSDQIVKTSFCFHVVLCDRVFSDIPAAFPFTWQKTDPLKLPIFRAVVTVVFHVIPNAQAYFQELITAAVRVVNAVPFSAQFDSPKIIVEEMILIGEVFIGFVFIS